MRKHVLRISWVIGALLFALLIYKIGPRYIWENIKNLTWQKFLILFFLHFIFFLFRTMNWRIIYKKYEKNAHFGSLLAARISGDAISYLTPSAYLGGEPVRALMATQTSRGKSLASVIVDKTIEVLIIILMIIGGVIIAISRIQLPTHYKLILLGFVSGAFFFIIFIFIKQRQGFLNWIFSTLKKIKIKPKFIEKNREKIEEIDSDISKFYKSHKKTFLLVFFLYAVEFLFLTAEIFVTLLFINAEGATFLTGFLIATLGSIVIIMPTVPASLGTYEITYVAVFVLLGLGADVAITLTLIRRIIGLSWSGVGLLLMTKKRIRMPP